MSYLEITEGYSGLNIEIYFEKRTGAPSDFCAVKIFETDFWG
jgi:hypothetical protein